ncbi:hypothetical protein F4811DRAFT_248013 [Daldinia bambusicola]|nr:hypothetical protein F4811DRAFT_248013 [Daldinia bambusicola]
MNAIFSSATFLSMLSVAMANPIIKASPSTTFSFPTNVTGSMTLWTSSQATGTATGSAPADVTGSMSLPYFPPSESATATTSSVPAEETLSMSLPYFPPSVSVTGSATIYTPAPTSS